MADRTAFLSIIIAAHNSEKTLSSTLQSLLEAANFDLSDMEIILLNDSSEDKTSKIMHDFSSHYCEAKVFNVNYKNIGQVRQFGVNIASGHYITMLDSDDLMKHKSLSEIISFLKKEQPDLLLTKIHEIYDIDQINYQWSGLKTEKLIRDNAITRFLIHKDFQAHLIGQFIKSSLYHDNTIPPMTCYEDFYIFPQILLSSTNIHFQRDSHYLYIKRSGSLSNTPDHEKIINLINCTQKMTLAFGNKFHRLVLCHWLDIYIKYDSLLRNEELRILLHKYVRQTHKINFFLASGIRLSYKRKSISVLLRSIKQHLNEIILMASKK